MPYGELWVNQRNTTYDERYKFTGKERDAETGYDFFGARNYSSAITTWLSPDPLADKYPSISSYAYCNWNPLKYVDPDGREKHIFASNRESNPARNFKDDDGNVLGWGDDNGDDHVYEVLDDWDGSYESLGGCAIIVGWEIIGKDGRKPHYVKGAPTYYLGSITKVSLVSGHWMVVGSTALIFGNKTITQEIDNSTSAFLHYFLGFGSDIALGNDFTRRSMLANSDFINNRKKILNGELDKIGFFAINMTSQVFHIGKTSVYYRSNDAYTIFCMGANDGYWDVLYLLEKSSRNPNGITPDGDGWKLEVSIPYHYIPIAVMLPNN